MSFALRSFSSDNIEFALEQTAREGWDSTKSHFRLCLAHDCAGCFIAETSGKRAGMVTTTRYARTGWIGNLSALPPAAYT